MAKQLNVNLGFTADTSQAKAKIQELQNSLTALINTPTGNFGNKMTKDIQQGIKAAAELKTHLKNATNVETGSLDFSKLNQSIKQSGSSLDAYGQKLQALGADGQKAFMQFAQSVATSEIPIRRSNAMLTEMWTTLKNTARWQISSSILHGFMGALQSAYGYAQDLNESLNNIRIVTGKNIDEMATFAVQANKAAKALSATTTEYTDASLIYYQQGLDGAAVEERAAVTLKMANVSRQSAEVVSDQMTAVWNNFYDGSKSLEYYADVMTALGAATASSTDEISQGLEKFAAVADTVGLSYEYATAALATVTAETRQSADVVGTAFKTLFARIEGLSLGETLDDGTNLNKYSEALLKIGISVKDQNGQLKDMDSILNEMGSKWSTLAKDQQVALAQTVGGVRQYNQLIALMDNWDKFQQNLGTAQGSTGALQEQADIYAESWEAAQDRVRAAAEAIYSDLLNDEAFIDILNIVEDFLTLIDNIIDSVGGLQGVLTNVGAILLKIFSSQMSQGITNMAYSFQMMTKAGREKVQNEKTDFINNAVNSIKVDNTATPNANTKRQEMFRAELEVQQEMIEASSKMSEFEKQTNQILLDRQRIMAENAIKAAEAKDAAKNQVSDISANIRTDIVQEGLNNDFNEKESYSFVKDYYQPAFQQLQTTANAEVSLEQLAGEFNQGKINATDFQAEIDKVIASVNDLKDEKLTELLNNLKEGSNESNNLETELDEVIGKIKSIQSSSKKQISTLGVDEKKVDALSKSLKNEAKANYENKKATQEANKARQATSKSIKNAKGAQKQWSDTLVQSAQSTLSLVSALQSIINLGNIWSDENLTGGQKFLQILMALGTAIPMAISGFKGFHSIMSTSSVMQELLIIQTKRQTAAINEQNAAEIRNTAVKMANANSDKSALSLAALKLAAEKLGIEVTEESTHASLKKQIMEKLGLDTTKKITTGKLLEAAATFLTKKATDGETTSKFAATAITIQETLAQWGLNAALTPFIALMLAAVAAIMPYIAAAGLLAGAIALIALAVTEESRALKKAEEQEKQAAESAKRVADEINTINDALNKIQSTTETFKDLEKGTLEWYQALNEVNAEIQMLIDKYPKLLEMGAITIDNGLLGINEKGIEYITQENAKQTTVANNITLRAQQNTTQVKMDQGWNDFSFQSNLHKYGNASNVNVTASSTEEHEETMTNARNNFIKMAVRAYAVYGEAMFKSTEAVDNIREAAIEANNGLDYFGESSYNSAESSEQILEILKNNKDLIIEQHSLQKKINTIDNQILMSRMSLAGSLRDAQQTQELMGDVTGAYKQKSGNKKELVYTDPVTGDEVAWNMNQNKNYGKNGEALPKEIQDFMALQGEDVEYVAQRWGNLVLKINGEKEKFSADQVYDGLKELYDEANFEEELRGKLQEDLNNAFTNIALDDSVSADNLIAIDNFRLNLEESMTNLFPKASEEELEEKVNNMLETIVSAYGTSEESLAAFAQDTSFVDTASRQFQNLTETFQQGKISVDQYKQAIKELNAEGELNSMSAWFTEQADALGLKEEDAGKMQEYAKNLMELSKESGELSDSLAADAKSAADLAVEITRMNKGIDSLADGFENWSDVIKKSSKASAEYSDAMFEMKSALADVLDVESDLISSDFVEDHLDEIEKAAEGDAEAIDALRADMDEEIILNITSGQTDEFIAKIETLDSKVQDLAQNLPDIEVGAILDDTAFLEAANNLVEQSGMTADEANAYFAGIGYEPVYNTEEIENAQSLDVPNASTVLSIDHIGWSDVPVDLPDWFPGDHTITLPSITYSSKPTTKEPEEAPADMRLTSFSGDGTPPKIQGMRKKATGSQNNYSSSNSGGKSPGSSSKSSSNNSGSNKKQKTKKSEVVERYKEITDQLDDVTRATDKASKAADRLYGPARLKAMKDVSKSLKDELGLLEQKSKEVAKNYAEDQFYLNSVSKSAGLNFEYDEAGNITNYSGEMTKLYEQLRKAEASGDEDAISLAEEKIDTVQGAVDQYDETRELWEDVADEMDEKFYEWQDNNAAIFEYELEIKIDATEFENKFLEFEKDWFVDDAYSFAESVAATGQLLQNSEQNLQSYSQSFNELQQLFAEGKISQAAFMEQLQNLSDGALEEFGNIIEYDKEMMEAYGTQLELNSEELAKYTDRLEHLNSVLEHYNNLLDLTGQSQNYDARGKVLAAQEKNAANIYEVNKAYFDNKQAEADALKAQLDAALASGNEGAAELYQKQWEDADAAAREAQENMLSSAESWAEAIKATLENKLAGLADTLADALTGGKGFDQLNTELERLEATQEEFLTTTNKIYETNKLINTAQKEIDKTNNTVAKQKLKAFQQETSQLQNQGELSQFELDIQQKKYDLLLAEIALEEAQNAKSVVRLQRDSEGNFGYVYTADEQKTADAEQSVADAENALYNTQLEGANKYAAQRQELIQAMYDEMTALTEAYHNGEIQSEAEYEALMQETQAYYYDRLADNSRLYKIATSEDSRIVQEAWSSNLSIMSIDGQEFEKAVDQYMIDTKEHLQEFENKMDNLAEQVGIDADSLDDSLGKVEKASEDLKNEVVNKLLPAQQQNLDKINLLTSAYATNRKNTDLLKTAYGQLATAMGTAYTNASNLETQLRNTNQAAQLIGGTGWVQWDYSTGSGNESSGDLGGGKDNDDNLTTTSRSTAKTYKKADYARQGNKIYVKLNNGYWFSENDLIYQGNDVYSIKSGSYGGNLGLYGLEKIKQFDTGGYTGEWGSSEGKLAFVHEKELILNKEDTKNFLEAIKLLKGQYRDGEITIEEFGYLSKELESAIQNSVNAQRAMLASCLEYAEKQSKSTLSFNNKLNDTLEQHVTIEAVFPNVEDRYEIEEAFMNLTNEASQYINRKNN